MGKTKIEWVSTIGQDGSIIRGHTWNPVRGCRRVSPGCMNCYAERIAARGLPGMSSPTTGQPFAVMTPSGPRWNGNVELIPHMLSLPMRRKTPTVYFVNSMSDLFYEDLPDEAIDRVFGAMELCPQHKFLILTKRDKRMQRYIKNLYGNTVSSTWKHVWLGVSVESRERTSRIYSLRNTPSAVRLLSLEPLLEDPGELNLEGINWVIIGGESGPGARPFVFQWAINIIRQCRAAGCKVFVKQVGSYAGLKDSKGGDMSEWPPGIRVREYPDEYYL